MRTKPMSLKPSSRTSRKQWRSPSRPRSLCLQQVPFTFPKSCSTRVCTQEPWATICVTTQWRTAKLSCPPASCRRSRSSTLRQWPGIPRSTPTTQSPFPLMTHLHRYICKGMWEIGMIQFKCTGQRVNLVYLVCTCECITQQYKCASVRLVNLIVQWQLKPW